MHAEELWLSGIRLYGVGLSPLGYIRALSQDLQCQETDMRRWWYGLDGTGVPNEVADSLEMLEARWNFAQRRHAT